MFVSNAHSSSVQHPKPSVLSTVETLKEFGQDFEFYPTTKAMLSTVRADISCLMPGRPHDDEDRGVFASVLDVGAGNGSSLEYLTNGNCYAIEKSQILIDGLSRDIVIVGTDFKQCTLIDKKVDVIFCNPPYSEYEQWMDKVIREANSLLIYFIVPTQWKASSLIKEALKARDASAEALKKTDFFDAERRARAEVDILRVDIASVKKHEARKYGTPKSPTVDPFSVWFSREFPFNEETAVKCNLGEGKTLKDKVKNRLVPGAGLITVLTELYNLEMDHLSKTYKHIAALDPVFLKEVGVSTENIQTAVEEKIAGLKHKYWHEFFDNYASITDRLASGSRKKLLGHIRGNVSVDFNPGNAYAITSWVIKNANAYFDSQLVAVFEDMIDEANVIKYASNKRVFKAEEHRYNRFSRREALGRVALDYRVVISKGGIALNDAWSRRGVKGLDESAHDFINDLIIIGKNLGYSFASWVDASNGDEWVSGEAHDFRAIKDGKESVFMSVRAYKNGNLHFKFNTEFMKKLNVMHGKLKGWIKNGKDVEREFCFSGKYGVLKTTEEEAKVILSASNYCLLPSSANKILLEDLS